MLRALVRTIRGINASTALTPPETTSIFLSADSKYSRYEIGDWTYGKPAVMTWDGSCTLKIGRFCSISDGVVILLGGEHRTDWVTTYPFNILFPDAAGFQGHPHTKGDVVIGNDVWIGTGAMILSGVSVGNGAVIGARSLVTHDVPPYGIVGGNPARLIRLRFSESEIALLQEIAWWDWEVQMIKEAWPLLLSNNVAEFISKYRPQ